MDTLTRVRVFCHGIHNELAMLEIPAWRTGLSFFRPATPELEAALAPAGSGEFTALIDLTARVAADLALDDPQPVASAPVQAPPGD